MKKRQGYRYVSNLAGLVLVLVGISQNNVRHVVSSRNKYTTNIDGFSV